MKNKLFGVALILIAIFTLYTAFKDYRETNVELAIADKVDELQKKGAAKYGDEPKSRASAKAAIDESKQTLNSDISEQRKMEYAAGNFLGYYLVNSRARVEFCNGQGVDISNFAQALKDTHESELAKATAVMKESAVVVESLYEESAAVFADMIKQAMVDEAAQLGSDEKAVCEVYANDPENVVNMMRFENVMPDAYQQLMNN